MAKKTSSKPDETGGAPVTPFDEATTDAASTLNVPLPLPVPESEEGQAPALPNAADAEVCPPIKPGARRVTLKQARALHAAKHLAKE